MSGDNMEKTDRISVVFDYTSFLGTSCTKKWTFSDALVSFAPVFGTVWHDTVKDGKSHEERLWDMALQRLSSRRSDESNLVTLVKLAKLEGIEELKLVMPYSLDAEQIAAIQIRGEAQIKVCAPEEFIITL
ncbi:transporter [Vibrio fluvialis]|uniref:transporter n=1 Tax=Vibrio fluvialis TaxID=676 RepID=UPI00192CB1D8|nr:transporter [Vibrio fluvialis]EKO3409361.1 transporter [Vibrio fluvialis]EKO3902727.1 transporter [Vibrio fluvialis]ELP2651334.1 transporter [Vibrio fluvialis]MBL4278914.1 transporter [Vibrio fluvialis]MBY8224638.1 transporter [Vibrio fluvialis]